MKKKIEEFDLYGVDLSRKSSFQTLKGGIFTIIFIIVSILSLFNSISSFFKNNKIFSLNYIANFERFTIANYSFDNTTMKVIISIKLDNGKGKTISDLLKYYSLAFEYQSPDLKNIKAELATCVNISDKSATFNLPLKNEYFTYHKFNLHPRLILENCTTVQRFFDAKIENCINSDSDNDVYSAFENTIFNFSYYLPNYQIIGLNNITINKLNSFLFTLQKDKENAYIAEMSKMNVRKDDIKMPNYIFNETYINWKSPIMVGDLGGDSLISLIFSFRLENEVFYYSSYNPSLLEALESFGGTLKISILPLMGISKLWNSYYMEKALFQVAEYYKEDINAELKKLREKKKEKKKKDKDKDKEEEEDKFDLNIDWEKFLYCSWFWNRCICNCTKRKKKYEKLYKFLIKKYQCKACVRVGSEQDWFNLADIGLDDSETESIINYEPKKESSIQMEINSINEINNENSIKNDDSNNSIN